MYLPYVAQHVIAHKKCYTIGVSYNMWINKFLGGGLRSELSEDFSGSCIFLNKTYELNYARSCKSAAHI